MSLGWKEFILGLLAIGLLVGVFFVGRWTGGKTIDSPPSKPEVQIVAVHDTVTKTIIRYVAKRTEATVIEDSAAYFAMLEESNQIRDSLIAIIDGILESMPGGLYAEAEVSNELYDLVLRYWYNGREFDHTLTFKGAAADCLQNLYPEKTEEPPPSTWDIVLQVVERIGWAGLGILLGAAIF